MEVSDVIWLEVFVEKLQRKHYVRTDEAEEVLYGRPKIRKVAGGNVAGEDVYSAMGQTPEADILLCSLSLRLAGEHW